MRVLNELLVLTFRAQGALYRLFARQTGAALQMWNMPALTDVERLRKQVDALSAEVRDLNEKLERRRRETNPTEGKQAR